MSTPPPAKRQKYSPSAITVPASTATTAATSTAADTTNTSTSTISPEVRLPPIQQSIAPRTPLNTAPPPTVPITPTSPTNPRKRTASSRSPKLNTLPPGTSLPSESSASLSIPALLSEDSGSRKKGRTNTPWTAVEEQRLKQMRDTGNSWGEIAKAFPNRTEGSVKKHWYKDMHYAEFAEDESAALRDAIKEYEANKWKAIGAKLGKPAKACEQYAREHFRDL